MNVILHIGAPGCGDRELFRFAARHREQLRERGLWFPSYEAVGLGSQVGHDDLTHAILGEPNGRFDFEGGLRFVEAVRRASIPGEWVYFGMSRLLMPHVPAETDNADVYQKLRSRTAAAAARLFARDNVRISVVLERPDRYAYRTYVAAVLEQRYTRSIGTFLRNYEFVLDPNMVMTCWARHFDRIELSSFDDLIRLESPIHAYFESLGFVTHGLAGGTMGTSPPSPAIIEWCKEIAASDVANADYGRLCKSALASQNARSSESETPSPFAVTVARRLFDRHIEEIRQLVERHSVMRCDRLTSFEPDEARPDPRLDSGRRERLFEAAADPPERPLESRGWPTVARLERRVATQTWQLRRRIWLDAVAVQRNAKSLLPRVNAATRNPRASQQTRGTQEILSALAVHDFEGAHTAALALQAIWSDVPPPARSAAAVAICRVHRAVGDTEALLEFSSANRAALRGTIFDPVVRGQSRPVVQQLVHRSGVVNTYVADHLIEQGRIDAEDIARLLEDRGTEYLRNPELDLLLANAANRANPEVSAKALGRLLRAHRFRDRVEIDVNERGVRRFAFTGASSGLATAGPRVSILMSAFNAAASIECAIRSVLEQSYRDIELLVADDDSSDETARRLMAFRNHPKVRLFRSVANQGPYNLRNLMLPHATGEFVTVQDADDIALPCRIERQVQALASTGTDACVANWIRVRPNGTFVFFHDLRAVRLSIVSLMVRRSTLVALGPFSSARFGADFEMYERIQSKLGRSGIARLREPLLFGLWSAGSLTRTPGAEALESGFRSSARRAYARAAVQAAAGELGREAMSEVLRATGNFAEPQRLEPL